MPKDFVREKTHMRRRVPSSCRIFILTVAHLQDAALALDVWQLVPHVRHLAIIQNALQHRPGLVRLAGLAAARGINVVTPGKARVNRAVERIIASAIERVFVEACLRHHSIRVVHIGRVAKEELYVTLLLGVHGNEDEVSREFICWEIW